MTQDSDGVEQREFHRRVLGGMSWTAGAQVATQVVTFLAGVLLARLLTPNDFGIVGMALAYLAFLWLLGQVGFNSAIIYLDDVSDIDLSTMFWANLAIQLLLLCLAIGLAPLAGTFFRNPEVVPVIRVASLGLIATALFGVHKTLLEKRLNFRRLARNQFIGSFVYGATSVGLAFSGFGLWSLVVGRLVGDVVDSLLAGLSAGWRPRFAFSRSSLMRLLGYGSRVWAGNVLYYGQENIDNLVVGRVLGATALGYYSFAFRLANVPRYVFSGVVARVMFPSFSSGRKQPQVLKQAFLRIDSYSILVALGLCVGLALVAPEFVLVVYGQKWLPAVPALRILAVAAGFYCSAQVTGPVLLATGRPGLHTKLAGTSTLVLTIGVLAGARFGLSGVALGVLAAVSLAFGLGQYFAARVLGVGRREYLRAVVPSILAVGGMALAVWIWRVVGQGLLEVSNLPWLVLAVIFGGLALVGAVALTSPSQLADIAAAGRGFRRGRESDGEPAAREPSDWPR